MIALRPTRLDVIEESDVHPSDRNSPGTGESHSQAEAVKRIQAMAVAHDLLSSRRWQGISLTELVRRELAPYITSNNAEISGPDIMLRADAGQALAMVLHELATNAAKFGALSATGGHVSVSWTLGSDTHAQDRLCLDWQERGGPNVVTQVQSSYGSVIRNLIPYELGGTVDLVHAPDGVCCKLEIPDRWFFDPGNAQICFPRRTP